MNHSKTSVQIRFQSFLGSYPKKKAKGDALKAFNKLNPDDGLMEKMLSALEWQKKSFDWSMFDEIEGIELQHPNDTCVDFMQMRHQ